MERFDVFTLFYFAIYLIAIDIRYNDTYEGFISSFHIKNSLELAMQKCMEIG